jgi:hypothetical protein
MSASQAGRDEYRTFVSLSLYCSVPFALLVWLPRCFPFFTCICLSASISCFVAVLLIYISSFPVARLPCFLPRSFNLPVLLDKSLSSICPFPLSVVLFIAVILAKSSSSSLLLFRFPNLSHHSPPFVYFVLTVCFFLYIYTVDFQYLHTNFCM